jgi:predicted PurR-regulated permease PerM
LTTAITSFIPFVGFSRGVGPYITLPPDHRAPDQGDRARFFGVFGIGLVDNIVRPIFIRGGRGLSFLLTFFAVLGGIQAFGLIGLIVGPPIMALYISIIDIVANFEGNAVDNHPGKEDTRGL